MSILDSLEKMMMLEQMNAQGGQQPMPQGYGMPQQQMMQPGMQGQMGGDMSPLEKGSMSALESAKHSLALRKRMLEMDDIESQRALGKAVLTMRDSMNNNPTYGRSTSGNINAILSGISDGMLNYDSERERIANANNVLLEQQKKEEALARHEALNMKKLSHEMDIAHKRLKLDQGYYSLKKQEREDELKEHKLLTSGGKIPLSALKTSSFNSAKADIKNYLDLGNSAKNTLYSIEGAKKILKENPSVTNHWSIISLAAQKHEPSILRQAFNRVTIPEKTRKDVEMLSKHLSNLYTSKLPGFSRLNMFLEKQLREGSVDVNMLPESVLELLEEDEKVAKHHYKNGHDVYNEYKKGNYYMPPPIEFEKFGENDMPEEVKLQNSPKPSSSAISEEQKQTRIQELLKMRETAPE